MQKLLLSGWCIAQTLFAVAQTQFIPASASRVAVFDLSRLSAKTDLKNISGYGMMAKSPDSLVRNYFRETSKRMIATMEESGIDLKKKFVAAFTEDSMQASIYFFPLTSAKKARSIYEKFNEGISWPDQKLRISKKGKATCYVSARNEFGAAVFDNLCIAVLSPQNYYYNDDEYIYDKAIDSVKLLIDSIRYSGVPEPVETNPGADSVRGEENPDDGIDSEPVYAEFNYDTHPLMIAFRAWWQKKRDENEAKWWLERETRLVNYLNGLYQDGIKGKNLQNSNARFAAESSKPADIFNFTNFTPVWKKIVTGSLTGYIVDEDYNYRDTMLDLRYEQTPLGKFLGETILSGHGDFNNGNAGMRYELILSDSLKKYASHLLGNTVNPGLFEYIKAPQVATLSSKNFHYQNITELYMQCVEQYFNTANLFPLTNNLRSNISRSAAGILQLAYAMLDKDMLYRTFTGNTISAITGTLHARESYQSWEYDEEGNYVSVTKYRDNDYPKFVSVFELDQAANLEKLLAPMEKAHWVTRNGNAYTFWEQRPYRPTSIFLLKTANAMIITNDTEYLNPAFLKLPGGLDKTHVENICSKSMYVEMNGAATGNLLSGLNMMGPLLKERSLKVMNGIENVSATANNGLNDIQINFAFKNKNRCSLTEMLEMIDIFYSE